MGLLERENSDFLEKLLSDPAAHGISTVQYIATPESDDGIVNRDDEGRTHQTHAVASARAPLRSTPAVALHMVLLLAQVNHLSRS